MSDSGQGVLDLRAGEVARAEALERVEEHAPSGWNERAERVVLDVARRGEAFTSDEVWSAGLARPAEPRALGAVLARLSRRGLLVRVGYRATAQATRHAAPISVWRLAP